MEGRFFENLISPNHISRGDENIMEQLKSYLEDIRKRIQRIYEDLVVGRSAVLVELHTKDSVDDESRFLFNIAKQQNRYSISDMILNFCILFDDDKKCINFLKILNSIQSNPTKFDLDSNSYNHNFTKIIGLIYTIKNTETYKDWIYFRDKLIAHRDFDFSTESLKLDFANQPQIIDAIVVIFNYLAECLNSDSINEMDYNEKSELYKLSILRKSLQ